MKRYLIKGILLSLSIILMAGCAPSSTFPVTDRTVENWQHEVSTQTTSWTANADKWFLTGEPNASELANDKAFDKDQKAISTMHVQVPEFKKIKVNGLKANASKYASIALFNFACAK